MSQAATLHLVPPLQPSVASARPAPRPSGGPVLMGDTMSTLGGEPLLLALWRRWEEEARQGDRRPRASDQ